MKRNRMIKKILMKKRKTRRNKRMIKLIHQLNLQTKRKRKTKMRKKTKRINFYSLLMKKPKLKMKHLINRWKI